jgi:hypothetical protein
LQNAGPIASTNILDNGWVNIIWIQGLSPCNIWT